MLQEVLAKSCKALTQTCPSNGAGPAVSDRGATRVWATTVKSGRLVLSPASVRGPGYSGAHLRVSASPSPIWISANSCVTETGRLGRQSQTSASDLSRRGAHDPVAAAPETGECAPHHASSAEPRQRMVEYGCCG